MVTDSIGDSITRIRNGYMAHQKSVTMPHVVMVEHLMRVLSEKGYVKSYAIEKQPGKKGTSVKKQIVVALAYKESIPVLSHIERISKPGIRRYRNKRSLPRVLSGLGISVISTSKGLMSDDEARKKGLGGEVVCTVY